MKNKRIITMSRVYMYGLALLILTTACDSEPDFTPCKSDYEQAILFENVATNLIVPAYANLTTKAIALEEATNAFVDVQSEAALRQVQSIFQDAYLSFQDADLYGFGPAETALMRSTLNNFPADTTLITKNLSDRNWDLTKPDAFDRGFPALDYLLFGLAQEDAAILQYYKDHPATYDYLAEIVTQIKTIAEQVNTAWNEAYKEQFIANTGTAAGSSTSQLINALNEHYESIKRDKIGIPSGVTTLGFTNPTASEAYYSGLSLDLAMRALRANFNLFTGLDGAGLDDYLEEANTHRADNQTTASEIKQQYALAMEALEAIEIPLSVAVEEQNELVIAAYTDLVKQIVKIKNDLPETLCVPITYEDNPSDSD